MAKIRMETKLAASADMIWKTIGGFNALPAWHPAVQKSESDGERKGAVRTLKLAGGGTITERSSEFQPANVAEGDAVKTIQGIYQAGFDNLRKMFGG